MTNFEIPDYHEPTPVYVEQDFYGPLQLAPEMAEFHESRIDNPGHYFAIHPEDPTKLVRFDAVSALDGDPDMCRDRKEDIDRSVAGTQQTLAGLTRHHIAHVNPEYIYQENGFEPGVMIVVDRLKNIRPYKELLAGNDIDPKVVYEADQMLVHMFEYAHEVVREGGYVNFEMMWPKEQFVYDDSRPRGQKMVLVDVEPIGKIAKIAPCHETYEYPSSAVQMMARLGNEVIELAQKTDQPLQSLETATRVISALTGFTRETDGAKAILLHALEIRQVSKEAHSLSIGGLITDHISARSVEPVPEIDALTHGTSPSSSPSHDVPHSDEFGRHSKAQSVIVPRLGASALDSELRANVVNLVTPLELDPEATVQAYKGQDELQTAEAETAKAKAAAVLREQQLAIEKGQQPPFQQLGGFARDL